ncbi:hypothetical protein ES703_123880 [subsurface metagenome]
MAEPVPGQLQTYVNCIEEPLQLIHHQHNGGMVEVGIFIIQVISRIIIKMPENIVKGEKNQAP